jgi:hypothetical protein
MNANDQLSEHTGSETFYKTMLQGLVHSEGVYDLCEKFKCWWFLDIILSYQIHKKVKGEEFQVWILKRTEDEAIVICEDGNENRILSQKIPYTDFKPDIATVWVENNVIYLPSER